MPDYRKILRIFFILLAAGTVRAAEVPPFSFSFFGIYASPYAPDALAGSDKDAVGFNLLGEWNPTTNASLGLGFERTTFYSIPIGFTAAMLNLEARVFPLENGKGDFSPYVMGGAGVNLSSGQAPFQLKAALGSRVTLVTPVYLDMAVGAHWLQGTDAFQYIDGRFGLGFSFDLTGNSDYANASNKPSSKPTPKKGETPVSSQTPSASLSPSPTVEVSPSPTPSPVVETIEVPTPTEVAAELSIGVESGPVSAIKAIKNYYRLGMNAFLKHEYSKSLKLLNKSIAVKEAHVASYYYAETYATMGVIYHFHSTVPSHKKLALKYYRMALKIDPTTKSAKKFIKLLEIPVKKKKPSKKITPSKPSDDSASTKPADTSNSDLNFTNESHSKPINTPVPGAN